MAASENLTHIRFRQFYIIINRNYLQIYSCLIKKSLIENITFLQCKGNQEYTFFSAFHWLILVTTSTRLITHLLPLFSKKFHINKRKVKVEQNTNIMQLRISINIANLLFIQGFIRFNLSQERGRVIHICNILWLFWNIWILILLKISIIASLLTKPTKC